MKNQTFEGTVCNIRDHPFDEHEHEHEHEYEHVSLSLSNLITQQWFPFTFFKPDPICTSTYTGWFAKVFGNFGSCNNAKG